MGRIENAGALQGEQEAKEEFVVKLLSEGLPNDVINSLSHFGYAKIRYLRAKRDAKRKTKLQQAKKLIKLGFDKEYASEMTGLGTIYINNMLSNNFK